MGLIVRVMFAGTMEAPELNETMEPPELHETMEAPELNKTMEASGNNWKFNSGSGIG